MPLFFKLILKVLVWIVKYMLQTCVKTFFVSNHTMDLLIDYCLALNHRTTMWFLNCFELVTFSMSRHILVLAWIHWPLKPYFKLFLRIYFKLRFFHNSNFNCVSPLLNVLDLWKFIRLFALYAMIWFENIAKWSTFVE